MRCQIQTLAFTIAISCMAVAGHGAETIRWGTDLQAAFRQAQASNRPLLLHFWTDDCLPCKRLEHSVFNQPQVANTIQDFFVPVKIDANRYPDLASRYGVKSVPKDVIVTADDQELHRMLSPQDPDQYVAQLSAVAFRVASNDSPRRETDAVPSSALGDRSNDRRWPPSAHEVETSGGRYNTDSVYSRNDAYASSTLPAYRDAAAPYGSDRQQLVEEPPREVINRFARRAPNEDLRAESPVANDTTGSDRPASDSQWATWPQRNPIGRNGDEMADASSPVATKIENRYVDDRETNHGATPSAVPPQRRPTTAPKTAAAPLGLDGYCPVSLIRGNSWTKGDPRYGVIHRGRTYLFAGPSEKELFFADPDEFSPVLAGVDPVELASSGDAVTGERAHGVVYRKRVYLFSSEANLQRFWEEPERYASPIRQAMETGDVDRLFR